MSQSKTGGTQNKQSAHMSEEELAKQRAGKTEKSSEDAKSRIRASTGKGAGGGAKQKQNH